MKTRLLQVEELVVEGSSMDKEFVRKKKKKVLQLKKES